MAVAKSTTPTLTAPASTTGLPSGADIAFFEKGIDAYERLRLNGDVEIKMPDGSVQKGTVRSVQVGPLIDLLQSYGHQHVSVYGTGRMYTANSLIQALTAEAGVDVLDVTKLYTAIMVLIPMQSPQPI